MGRLWVGETFLPTVSHHRPHSQAKAKSLLNESSMMSDQCGTKTPRALLEESLLKYVIERCKLFEKTSFSGSATCIIANVSTVQM